LDREDDIDPAGGKNNLWLRCVGQHRDDPRDPDQRSGVAVRARDVTVEVEIQRHGTQEKRVLEAGREGGRAQLEEGRDQRTMTSSSRKE
jgi:hypothetical protein